MYKYDAMAGYTIGDKVIVRPREKEHRKIGEVVAIYYNFWCGLFGVAIDGREYIYRSTSLKHYDIDKFDKKYGKI